MDPQTQQPTNQAPAAQPAQSSGFTFTGTPGGYFKVFLATVAAQLLIYILVGLLLLPLVHNYAMKYVIENVDLNGKKFKFEAEYGETLGFLLLNVVLVVITLGIYSFWFVPKYYRWILEHTSYAN